MTVAGKSRMVIEARWFQTNKTPRTDLSIDEGCQKKVIPKGSIRRAGRPQRNFVPLPVLWHPAQRLDLVAPPFAYPLEALEISNTASPPLNCR